MHNQGIQDGDVLTPRHELKVLSCWVPQKGPANDPGRRFTNSTHHLSTSLLRQIYDIRFCGCFVWDGQRNWNVMMLGLSRLRTARENSAIILELERSLLVVPRSASEEMDLVE